MIYPEIFLLISILLIIIISIKINKKKKFFIIYILSISILFICSLLIIKNIIFNNIGYLFYNTFILDDISNILKLFTCIITIINFFYFYLYNKKNNKKKKNIFYNEYYILTLFSILGEMIIISGNSLLSIYLGLELVSISFCTLISIDINNYKFNNLNIKYFIINIILSGFFLYGSSIIYGITGVLEINKIFYKLIQYNNNYIIIISIIFIILSLSFKLAIAPFHILISDIYKNHSTSIAMLMNNIPKLGIFSIIFHLLLLNFFILNIKIQKILIILSILSIIIGSICTLKQNNIKSMIAYSSVFNIGFLILNISYNNINIYEYINAFSTSLFYIIIYIFIISVFFGIILNINKLNYNNNNIKKLNNIKDSLLFNIFTLILILSLSGIPPFIGFYIKLFIFKNILKINNISFILIILIFSLIGIIYILKIIKNIYFFKKKKKKKKKKNIIKFILLINILIIIIINIYPDLLINFCYKTIINSFMFVLLNNISYGAGGN